MTFECQWKNDFCESKDVISSSKKCFQQKSVFEKELDML